MKLHRVRAGRRVGLGFLGCAAALLLTACATPSTPGPIAEPAPKAPDVRLCAKAEPEPSISGSIVQPASDDERAGTAAFLTSVAEALSWGRRGWERASVAATGCAR